MMNALLRQILHHKTKCTPRLMMRQAALHMLKHPDLFYPYVKQELIDTAMSYESFVYNVYHSRIWGDDFVLAVIGHMFNISISVVSPCFDKPLKLFHNENEPDVVVVANGGSWMSLTKPCTHFSVTLIKGHSCGIVGAKMINPKLDPIIMDSKSEGREHSSGLYLKVTKEKTLDCMRIVSNDIRRLDNKICQLIHESDKLLEFKSDIEYRLIEIGMDAEEIAKLSNIPPREYVRTSEREKRDKEDEERKKEEAARQKALEEEAETVTEIDSHGNETINIYIPTETKESSSAKPVQLNTYGKQVIPPHLRHFMTENQETNIIKGVIEEQIPETSSAPTLEQQQQPLPPFVPQQQV